MSYRFEPLTPAHLPLLMRWLRHAPVREWWGDPTREMALIRGDLRNPRIDLRLVRWRGRPIGYVQDYNVRSWPQAHLAGLPPRTRAVDTFVGAGLVGGGHGSRFLRLRAAMLLRAGAPMVIIDPDPGNARACAAYRRAGFRDWYQVQTPDGPALVMRFEPFA